MKSTLTGRDWFSHTGFVRDSARRQVNAQLDTYIATLTRHLDNIGDADTTICVSGSLARAEPAVRRSTGPDGWELASDVDLVAVTSSAIADPAPGLLHALSTAHPDIHTSLYHVHAAHLPRLAGRFGADLHAARTHPLAGPPLPNFDPPACGRREGLEGIVHQLALSYTDDRPTASPWRTKTALEALRGTGRHQPGRPQRYSRLATSPAPAGLERSEIESLIRAREYTLDTPLPEARLYSCVLRALATLLAADEPSEVAIAETIARMPQHRSHVLNGFQLAVVADTLLAHGSARSRRCAAAALHLAISRIDPDTLPTAAADAKALARISPVDLSAGTARARTVIDGHMRRIRGDYYHWLGPHNFGAVPASAYLEPHDLPTRTEADNAMIAFPAWTWTLPVVNSTFPGAQGRLLASPHGQTVLWSFPDGGTVPPHRHGPQFGIILAGAVTLLIESEPRHLVAGDYFEIGDDVQHSAVIAPGSLTIEVFAQPDLHTARPA